MGKSYNPTVETWPWVLKMGASLDAAALMFENFLNLAGQNYPWNLNRTSESNSLGVGHGNLYLENTL